MTLASASAKSSARPSRVQALATLPVFYRLTGRRVLVAGGSRAAAWKAELLAATGAEVHVHASDFDLEFDDLLAANPGRIVLHRRGWADDAFNDAILAVCDAEDEREAEAFSRAARAAGVPVNVIDEPDWCDFQFGSIVNRSPAIVAISTDGAAPILGQAIRRRIETLLPPALAEWAALARTLRATVTASLAAGPQRRIFWERFVDWAFGPAPQPGAGAVLIGEARAIAAGTGASQGRVTFVGAGPGDAELLTLKAVRALQAADVILFDETISREVLELARREARRMLVADVAAGGGGDAVDAIAALAAADRHVVRLVAGDAADSIHTLDAARLRKAGVSATVIPGIAASAPLASSDRFELALAG